MTPFHDLRDFVAIQRVSALRLSPDGARLVAVVSELAADRKKFVTALWQIDPLGKDRPRRLTRSAPGEASPEFLPDGSLLFTSARPDPEAAKADGSDTAALWLLPAGGGEARQVATPPGGVSGVAVARDAGTVAFAAPVMPGTSDLEEDERRRRAREDGGVSALLHEAYPVRHWDHDLGPAQPRIFVADPPDGPEGRLSDPRDLTPEPGRALDEQRSTLTPDGSVVVTGWLMDEGAGERRQTVVAVAAATGERRALGDDPDHEFEAPAVSPDGREVVCVRSRRMGYDEPHDQTLWLVGMDGSGGRDLTAGLDLWPAEPVWAPDSAAVFFVADEQGGRPVFRVDVRTGAITRLTGDRGAYSEICPAPDGAHLYALRNSVDEPPAPVRLDTSAADQEPARLPAPGTPVAVPGELAEVTATAEDGRALRAWLVLPKGVSPIAPVPMLLWIHGGPLASWNGWHWRWNPWIMAAHGYAVLLPDPALSTGYGQHHIRSAWGNWGGPPYTDLLTITSAAVERPDIDGTRTAAMGGSFGGYMANWIAVNTDRFKAIVSHAGLWSFDQMFATTDEASEWQRWFGDPLRQPQRYEENSPHRRGERIRTPMLVIHGNRDYRVPVGEALRLWWDLVRQRADAKFLYFPDENHWVLGPGNGIVWYETVLAFLAHHVLGQEWKRPELV
ncbi:MAG: prolyl oligopeptidase family serine peptidase [Streptosporangiales bacterium]|nr:prolyl oligopeptidase family serine peptidase [Streptosporangiales bacterium]